MHVHVGGRRTSRSCVSAAGVDRRSPSRLRSRGEPRPRPGAGGTVVHGPAGALDTLRHQDHSFRPLGHPSYAGRPRDRPSCPTWVRKGSPDPV